MDHPLRLWVLDLPLTNDVRIPWPLDTWRQCRAPRVVDRSAVPGAKDGPVEDGLATRAMESTLHTHGERMDALADPAFSPYHVQSNASYGSRTRTIEVFGVSEHGRCRSKAVPSMYYKPGRGGRGTTAE